MCGNLVIITTTSHAHFYILLHTYFKYTLGQYFFRMRISCIKSEYLTFINFLSLFISKVGVVFVVLSGLSEIINTRKKLSYVSSDLDIDLIGVELMIPTRVAKSNVFQT